MKQISSSTGKKQCYQGMNLNGKNMIPIAAPVATKNVQTYQPPVVDGNDITPIELTKILMKHGNSSTDRFHCSLNKKKDLLKAIVLNLPSVKSSLKVVDSDFGNTSLLKRFELVFPQDEPKKSGANMREYTVAKLNRQSARELADMMVALHSIFSKAQSSKKFRSCHSSVKTLMGVLDQAFAAAIQDKEEEIVSGGDPILKGESLSIRQKNRKFMTQGGFLPVDEEYRSCAFCGHRCVDEPVENKTVNEKNEQLLLEDQRLAREWELSEAGNGPRPKKSNGKDYKSKPKPLKREKLLIQCHCHEFTCTRQNSDTGSTCIFACLDGNGVRFPWVEGQGCTCVVCTCPCRKAYARADTQRIQLAIQRQKAVANDTVMAQKKADDEARAEGKRFIGNCIRTGTFARHTLSETMNRMNADGKYTIIVPILYVVLYTNPFRSYLGELAVSDHAKAGYLNETEAYCAAACAGETFPTLSSSAHFFLQKKFSDVQRGSQITLDCGTVIDAKEKLCSRNSSHRATNNRLHDTTSLAKSIHAKNPNLIVSPMNAPSANTVIHVCDDSPADEVQVQGVYCTIRDDDDSSLDVLDRKPSADQTKDDAINDRSHAMTIRTLKKMRTQYTSGVSKLQEPLC